MCWINIDEKLPKSYEDVLVCDKERVWVASYINGVWLASHPDYKREKSEYGCPYLTISKPTHWMQLPKPPDKEHCLICKNKGNECVYCK